MLSRLGANPDESPRSLITSAPPHPAGASALDKRERKKWQAAMLSRLGAKPDKSPRTPAAIGIGMAKKQAQRDAKKLEEAFETGMAQRKGMGKKKRAAQSEFHAASCSLLLMCILVGVAGGSQSAYVGGSVHHAFLSLLIMATIFV
ncbi:hypothetical protein DUNSADRAFT_3889 [Dunaliella salina]|uniref:Uncharacterized protein n=1 Tax=Dunaliella salina TaxID=3046 RepID=A0ABQ7GT06_DUNSA|nr:hypothetical protein DUNSADRAFT_3889 [Dunaliella salina]|eukprot:KAF5837746.1 hypothetical protein DUNSADRAFT_3889 [Dunaliella salina]